MPGSGVLEAHAVGRVIGYRKAVRCGGDARSEPALPPLTEAAIDAGPFGAAFPAWDRPARAGFTGSSWGPRVGPLHRTVARGG
jgi:hypothetical protein